MPKVYTKVEEMPLPTLEDFRETVSHLRPEVIELAKKLSDEFSKIAFQLKASATEFSNVEAEALFVGALVVALSIKAATLGEYGPELQQEMDALRRDMKYGGN